MRQVNYRKTSGTPSARFTAAGEQEALKKLTNSARGAAGKRSGDTLERRLNEGHAIYANRQHAIVSKMNPSVVGPHDGLKFAGKNDCDYIGWVALQDEVQPVAFDVKSYSGAQFSLPTIEKNRRTMLHQIDYLLRFGSRRNALAFLLVVDREIEMSWLIMPTELRVLKEEGYITLRSRRSASAPFTHYQPEFNCSTVLQMAQGAPYIDWRAALLKHAIT